MKKKVMTLAWSFVRGNGLSIQEALHTAWLNVKVRKAMDTRIVGFRFKKVDGSVREAYGTLMPAALPPAKGTDKPHSSWVQVYFDTERNEYRCFKKVNLLEIISQ